MRDSTGLWKYTYVVSNAANSPRGIWSFTLEPAPAVVNMTGPTGWQADPSFQVAGQVNWFCVDPGPNPPENDGNVSPSPFDIAPGDSATFTLQAPGPPVSNGATYYLQGFSEVPRAQSDSQMDSLLDAQGSFLEETLSGTIVGPGSPSAVDESQNGSITETSRPEVRPNPATDATVLAFSLDRSGRAEVTVYDAAGRRIRTLVNEEMTAGAHFVSWDERDENGKPVGAGVFFYRLSLDGKDLATRKGILLR